MGTQAKARRTGTPGIREIFNLLVESGIQKNFANCEIQDCWLRNLRNTAQGIRIPTNDWNPESKFHSQRLKLSTWNPESNAWNPEFKTILDSLASLTLTKFFMKWGKVREPLD